MVFQATNTEHLSRSEPSGSIKTLTSGIWLARRLCINPAVAHEVITMMRPALAGNSAADRR
ncbi:MAG: hypothetical protein H7X76_01980 [Prolixibacteraceae bacterium]|nr:hypothetical protein [Burkholderiales bacterium]